MTVFCDVDGTLLDSSARHERLLRDLFREEELTWPRNVPDYLTYKADGHSTREWLEMAGVKRLTAEKIAGGWQARIERPDYLALDRPYPDAIPFLQALRALPARVILLSARQDEAALQATLRRWDLLPLTDGLVVVPPRGAAAAKGRVLCSQAAPGDVMVGDTEADLAAARQAKIPCQLLDRGFRSRRYWQQHGERSWKDLRAVFAAIAAPGKEE